MIRQVFSLNRCLHRLVYRFGHAAALFSLRNRENLQMQYTPKAPRPMQFMSEDPQLSIKEGEQGKQKHTIKASQDAKLLDVNGEWKQEAYQGEFQQIVQAWRAQQQSVRDCLRSFSQLISHLVSSGNFKELEHLVKTSTRALLDKHLTQRDIIELFSIIRSLRFRAVNTLILSASTEQVLRSFVIHPKVSKLLESISKSWEEYDKQLLLKLPALYRYLPSEMIASSLSKIFSLYYKEGLGYIKHLEMINQILQKKQKVQLGQLNHSLIMNGEIIHRLFKHHFGDFEVVMRFINKYNAFGGSKLLGRLVFFYISFIVRPERKGYILDYQLLKQAFSIYYTCVNLRTRVKVRFIEEMPYHIRVALETSSPSIAELLDGFFGLSNFSNCNQYFGRVIAESIKQTPEQEIRGNIEKIKGFLRYLLQSLKPEYCLSSMGLPSCEPITQNTINSVQAILPLLVDTFSQQFLQYQFDPYVYKLLFKNQSEFQPFLNKYTHLLQNSSENPLPILKLLWSNISQIDSNNATLQRALQSSWNNLDPQYHKWPDCLPYYYYFTLLSKYLNTDLKGLAKRISDILPTIKGHESIYQKRSYRVWPLLSSSVRGIEYFLPTLTQSSRQDDLSDSGVQRFIEVELTKVVRHWDVIPYYQNLKVVAEREEALPRCFTQRMLQNLSLLTMVHDDVTIIHPDIDEATIKKVVLLILDKFKTLQLNHIDYKVFQMMCISCSQVLNNNDQIKKLLEILGFKEQMYIPEMVRFLENFHFKQKDTLPEIAELFPPTFKNIQIDNYAASVDNSSMNEEKSQRQMRKYLTILLDKPKMRLDPSLTIKDMAGKEEKVLFLCNKFYEAILKIDGKKEIQGIEKQIQSLFALESANHLSLISPNTQMEQKMRLYDQFHMEEKNLPNSKFQLLKIQYIDAQEFQTVDLLQYPIEEQILRNISNSSHLENEVLPKLNADINPTFENQKAWFQKMGIIAKIKNNALMLRGTDKKNWQKSCFLIISKPEAFKLNLIIVYVLNKTSDVEFVVMEEESNIESAIKAFIYKKLNIM